MSIIVKEERMMTTLLANMLVEKGNASEMV